MNFVKLHNAGDQVRGVDESAAKLRALIARYRDRLSAGGGFETVTFCLRAIEDAERKLAAIAARESATPGN